MASDDYEAILRQPGRLCHTPTDLTASFPCGGTSLGLLRDGATLEAPSRLVPLKNWANSNTFDYLFHCADEVILRCDLRQYDTDSVQAAFPGGLTTAGTYGVRVIQWPGSTECGTLASSLAKTLLFVPDNRRGGKVVLLRKAVMILDEKWAQRWKRREESSFPLDIRAIPSTAVAHDQSIAAVGDIRDLSLT